MPEGKIRVYELAKILGVSSAKLMTLLSDLGVKVTDQMAMVDASLESRLKGLIRRPGAGGRGIPAARPEPTWLKSLTWPKSAKEEPAEPEGPPAPAARAGVGETEAEEAAPQALAVKPRIPATEPGDESPGGKRAAAGAAEIPLPRESEEEPAAPVKRRVVAEAAPEGTAPARPVERTPGPTLPSGRTPVPPPPPPPVRRGAERPAAGPTPRPATGPAARPAAGTAPRPATPAANRPAARPAAPGRAPAPAAARGSVAPAGSPGAGLGPRPGYPAAGAPGGAAARPAYPGDRRAGPAGAPGTRPTGMGPGPARPGAPSAGAYQGRTPARPYGGEAGARPGFERRPGYDRPERAGAPGRGPGGPGGPGARPGGPGGGWGGRPAGGAPGGYGRPAAPGRGPGGGAAPAKGVGQAKTGDRRERRGAGGVPSRGKAGRAAGGQQRDWRHDEDAERRLARGRQGRKGQSAAQKAPEPVRVRATEVTIDGPITVRDLAERMGVSGAELIKSLIRLGIVASLNQVLDPESARIAVSEMGVVVHTAAPRPEGEAAEGAEKPAAEPEEEAGLVARPPVVTVMGHVDHGKTSLLDAIRKTNVTAAEAGGITQHIGASTVDWQGKRIVFLDTPGHEAFTAMRARGAKATDIAVLVVAADDGVMPQTMEAINHARAAKVPIIVALNKIDKPNALPDKVKKQLSEQGLTPEDWGGDTIVVPVSAKERIGLDDLLDMILLVAEMEELRANPGRRAKGIVIETRLDKGLGPVATVLVQSGTLRVSDPVLAGTAFGRVRAMVDDKGRRLDEAGPSTPVEVIGLDELPAAGDVFQVLADERMAREIAAQRDLRRREAEMAGTRAATSLDDLFRQALEGEKKQLNLVLKADVQGSLEALRTSFEKLEEPGIGISIIHTGVGGVRETDVMLAAASDAIIIAFNVTPDAGARQAAEASHVDIRTYRVIYDAINDVKAAVKGLRAPTYHEVVLGHAEVRQLFRIPKVGTIAGCYVTDGKIARKNKVRVVRDGVIVHEGALASLKHVKDDVKDISAGFECGIGIENFQDIKEGDVIEAFAVEEVAG